MPETNRISNPMSIPESRIGSGPSAGSRHCGRRVLHVMRMKQVAGSENHLLELARGLRELGWTCDALIPSPDPEVLAGYASELRSAGGGEVTVLPMRNDLDLALLLHLRRILRADRHAILHTHLVHADWYGAIAAKSNGTVALVSSKHNHDRFRTRRAFKSVERLLARRCDATIAISASLGKFTHDTAGVTPTVVHYGLSAPANPPPAKDRSLPVTLLSVGRLEPQKGHDVLLHAFQALVRDRPGARLWIAGDGRLRSDLVALAEKLEVHPQVEFLGWRTDVDDLFQHADVLVHPARWEGFGLVLLEAMRAAVPIVATKVGAIPEVVLDGETGILVEREAPTALAEGLDHLLDDRARARGLGVAGFYRLKAEFSPVGMAARTAELYESASRGRAATAR